MKKRHIASIVIVAIVALAAFSIIPVSAQGDPGAGCTAETEFYDTIHGGVYFEQQGYAQNPMTKTFTDVPDGIKIARIYTGFWQGSPSKGGNFNITIANATGSYTTLTYQACDPCPGTPCAATQSLRCDALNWTGNVPPNVPSGEIHDYIVGCGVQFVSFDTTPYITPGSNTITVRTSCGANCTCWDGRIYVIALLVVYENSSMPEITYWINEGAPYLEKGSACDGDDDHLYASKYFNGTHVSDPIGVRLWSLGWPHVINADTKLNGNNIGGPDIIEKYGGSEVLLRWNNISTGYLGTTSNFLEYYDLNPVYERAFAEVLIVQAEDEKPDLIVTDINSYHNNTGCPAWFNLLNEIDVTVKNIGTANATETFNVCLSIDGVPFDGKLSVSGLNVNEEKTVTFENWKPIGDDCLQPPCVFEWSYKDYNFTGVADCDGEVAESNETNNETTVVDRACYNGYTADEPLENVAHGVLHGGLLYTTGNGFYYGKLKPGDTQVTDYDITLPDGATVELAQLNVYYTWTSPDHTCPEMEVRITNATGTHVVPLEKAYNDIKCTCGGYYVKTWGNYVFDLTDYITGSGAYTVTVENDGPSGHSFCPAAPGIALVYEDETAPLIEYWVNKGADVLLGGRRYPTSSNLAWWECINNATFSASTETEEVESATLGVVAPWGDTVKDDILFFNDVELGRGVYNGYSSLYDKTIDSLSMYVGASGNAQVGANVSDVTAQYLNDSENVVGQADDGDNIMACNAFLVVAYEEIVPPEADLVISEIWKYMDNCTICYNVTNIGNGTAPACHNTTLYVDGVAVAHDHVPVELEHGESYIGCFDDYTWTYTLPSDNITVCADNNETIDELDETNNCLTNIWKCGDVNCDGKVTMSDVRKVFNRYLDPNYPLDPPWAADVNCDGKVSMSDVRKVFNRYLDPRYELNCCCEGNG